VVYLCFAAGIGEFPRRFLNYHLVSLHQLTRCPAGVCARTSRNNMTAQLGYGSYPASIGSVPAPKDSVPRRLRFSSLPLWIQRRGLGACTQSGTDLLRLARAHTPTGHSRNWKTPRPLKPQLFVIWIRWLPRFII